MRRKRYTESVDSMSPGARQNFRRYVKRKLFNQRNQANQNNQNTQERAAQVEATETVEHVTKDTVYKSADFIQDTGRRSYRRFKRRTGRVNPRNYYGYTTSGKPIPVKSVKYRAKQYVINKFRSTKLGTNITKIAHGNIGKLLSGAVNAVKMVAAGVNNLYVFASAGMLVLVVTLLIGVFASIGGDGGSRRVVIPVAQEVLQLESTIVNYAREADIEEYVSILKAIMMFESRGVGFDLMNSSHSSFNTLFENGIRDSNYSIEVGVKEFAQCLEDAGCVSPGDRDHLYLAIQGYDYGRDYISWALTNYNGYSKENAIEYSNIKKSQLGRSSYGDVHYIMNVIQYVGSFFSRIGDPNFDNADAWVNLNPYAQVELYGQCTWFAWGRFYEIYGFDPGFTGDGWNCVDQLIAAHPDKFLRSVSPEPGAVFSGIGINHVGIVLSYNGDQIVIQSGNLDDRTNTFEEAKTDWATETLNYVDFVNHYGGVVYACLK